MSTHTNTIVTKASGDVEPFSVAKLKASLKKANASEGECQEIIKSILSKIHPSISSQKIYSDAFALLRQHSKHHAARYYLKRGVMELGPSGFPFEKLVGELFKHRGFSVEVGKTLQGKCVTHEIDVIAEKENEINLVECKYRNQPGIAVDVKTPLYIFSRFEDVLENESLHFKGKNFTGWVVTNSKFTSDAISFGGCKGMQLLSWDYPLNNSLQDWINRAGVFPLTCLTALTRTEKEWLLGKGYVLAKDIYNNQKLLSNAGVSELRIQTIREEGDKLLEPYHT